MKGWKIFQHSVRQVFGNIGAALRVSAVLYMVQIAALLAFTGKTFLASEAEKQRLMEAGQVPWLGLAAFMAVAVVCGLWIAVGWHRFVLTNEQPGLLPTFHGGRMWGYFWTAILLTLLSCLPIVGLIFVEIVMAMMGTAFVKFAVVFPIISMVVVTVVGFRLLTVLPGVALRADVGALSGWDATKGQTGTILLLVIIWSIFQIAGEAVMSLLFAANGAAGIVWAVLWFWAQTMIGLSIMTTLYGHYVEDRPLA